MGDPAPVRFAVPTDWSSAPLYGLALALGVLLTGLVVLASLSGRASLVVALLPLFFLGWFVWRVVRYLREARAFVFEVDAVDAPKLWLFGRPRRIAYADVARVESHRGMQLAMEDGSSIDLRFDDANRVVAAMRLRVGYAQERRGRVAEALALYKDASSEHTPPLDARIAFALWDAGYGEQDEEEVDAEGEAARVFRALAVDRQGAILTHLHIAADGHRAAFGDEDPMTMFLRRAIDRFRAEYPDATIDEDEVADVARTERGSLQDRWVPRPR